MKAYTLYLTDRMESVPLPLLETKGFDLLAEVGGRLELE